MAGTIPLSMTQQFNAQGVPLNGGKLYIFQTATTTPQNAYSDSGLTNALSNPVTLDSSGRVPQFFLADGTIKVRLTDSAGVIQAEWDNLLVIGPSGGGGGGIPVDPTTLIQTGDVLWLDQTGPRSGFVRDNGRTIGSATSGSTERANADCESLFSFLWNTYPDAKCPVSGGRGANAAADWTANKTITLPDKRFRGPLGLDDMGNAAAGRSTGALFSGSDTATTLGGLGGEAAHTVTQAELPIVNFAVTGSYRKTSVTIQPIADGGTNRGLVNSVDNVTALEAGAVAASGGGGAAHNNMQPFVLGTFYRKL
jgi:microcystin-dependent protein